MPVSEINDLVNLLCSPVLVNKTGILLIQLSLIGKEADLAAGLNLDSIDICGFYSKRLPVGGNYLALTWEKMINTLDAITQLPELSDCVLVYNIDLLLSKLTQKERNQTWDRLFWGFRHKDRAILLLISIESKNLIPDNKSLQIWVESNRAVII